MFSDPHLHYPYALSNHAELEVLAQRQLAARAGQSVLPLLTLPLVVRLVAEAARNLSTKARAPRSFRARSWTEVSIPLRGEGSER